MEKELQFPLSPSIARSRRSSKEMYPLVEQWLETRENQSVFCAIHKIPQAVFSYWLKKYRDENSNDQGGKRFVALSVKPSPFADFEVEYPNGVTIRISSGVQASFLREMAGQC